MREIGIIGCGTIGTLVAEAVETGIIKCDSLILYDYNQEKIMKLVQRLHVPTRIAKDVDEMIRFKPAIILEAASQEAVRDYLGKIEQASIELIVMSVGALLDVKAISSKVHFPSGAIGGLDALCAAGLAGIEEVVLTTRKNPSALGLDNRQEKTVYEGSSKQAVLLFPKEMNVAATLSLTVGAEKVRVRVVSDPKVARNVHEIRVRWKHGEMLLEFANDPHPQNPATSALAAWSAIDLLSRLLERDG